MISAYPRESLTVVLGPYRMHDKVIECISSNVRVCQTSRRRGREEVRMVDIACVLIDS